MKAFVVVVALSVMLAAVSRVCPGARAGAGAQLRAKPAPGSGRSPPRRAPAAGASRPRRSRSRRARRSAYVVLQRIANESADGRVATTRIQALQQKKAAELNEKNKQLTDAAAEAREGRLGHERDRRRRDLQKQIER